MTQNIYDDPDFLAGYSRLSRQVHGLDGAAEWPAMQSLLPDLVGAQVVDLGCGFGWFCRWASDQGARSILGVDISVKMLERARIDTSGPTIEYRRADLEELELPLDRFHLAYSSLALHYITDLGRLLRTVSHSLVSGGAFVFSVEHPIFSAPSSQAFEQSDAGRRVWPLEDYLVEGPRSTSWFVDDVIKQHRTIATYVNELITAGFELSHLEEWGPSAEQVSANPEWADERHRPPFLLIKATSP